MESKFGEEEPISDIFIMNVLWKKSYQRVLMKLEFLELQRK